MSHKKMLIMVSTLLLAQGVALHAMQRSHTVPKLEDMLARDYAQQIVDTVPGLGHTYGEKQEKAIASAIQAFFKKHNVPDVIKSLILDQLFSAVIATTLTVPQKISIIREAFASLPVREFAKSVSTIMGQHPEWSREATTIMNTLKAGRVKPEAARQLVFHLMLAPNEWSRAQKMQFMSDLLQDYQKMAFDPMQETFHRYAAWVDDLGDDALGPLLNLWLMYKEPSEKNYAGKSLDVASRSEAGVPTLHALILAYKKGPGSVDLLTVAKDVGADMNEHTADGKTALSLLTSNPWLSEADMQMIQALIKHGARVQVGADNALLSAVEGSSDGGVKALLSYAKNQLSPDMIGKARLLSQQVTDRMRTAQDQSAAQLLIEKQATIQSLLDAAK